MEPELENGAVEPAPLPKRLTDRSELLMRQVHESWMDKGRPASQAFRPTPKDKKLLSTARQSLTTAQEAYELHVGPKACSSVGVWGLSVEEVELTTLAAFADPVETPVPDSAHAVVDFNPVGTSQAVKISKVLAAKARERGCLYRPAAPVVGE